MKGYKMLKADMTTLYGNMEYEIGKTYNAMGNVKPVIYSLQTEQKGVKLLKSFMIKDLIESQVHFHLNFYIYQKI